MSFNFAFWLSLVLAAMGCTGLLLAGKGRWYGWGIGLAVQPVWATYAIVTKGYGLLLTCLMYGFVNAKNLWRWKKDTKRHQARDLYMNAWKETVEQVTKPRSTSPIYWDDIRSEWRND